MRKLYVVPLLLAALMMMSACGTSAHKTAAKSDANVAKQTIKSDKNTAKAKAAAEACAKKGGGLRAEARCAIPKGHGRAFMTCVFKHAPKNARRNEAGDIKDLEDCGVANR